MKNLLLLFAALFLGTGSSLAGGTKTNHLATTAYGYSDSFVFQESGISFAVYPDGEFDFYINGLVGVPAGGAALTFNGGFNYNPYVQYDDYGAVVQIQHVPVFYDYYGRVRRIGNIHISYRNGRMYRLGGMRVYYNPLGYYSYHVGYINRYNRFYVYQPFHGYFIRPATGFCMVYAQPYRRYYSPVRYTYHRPYHNNARRAYARVGTTHRHATMDRSRIYANQSREVHSRSMGSRATVQRAPGTSKATMDRSSRTVSRSAGRHSAVTEKTNGMRDNKSVAHRQSPSYKGNHPGSSSRGVVRNSETSRRAPGEAKYTRSHNGHSKSPARAADGNSKKGVASTRLSAQKDDRAGTRSRSLRKDGSQVVRRNPR